MNKIDQALTASSCQPKAVAASFRLFLQVGLPLLVLSLSFSLASDSEGWLGWLFGALVAIATCLLVWKLKFFNFKRIREDSRILFVPACMRAASEEFSSSELMMQAGLQSQHALNALKEKVLIKTSSPALTELIDKQFRNLIGLLNQDKQAVLRSHISRHRRYEDEYEYVTPRESNIEDELFISESLRFSIKTVLEQRESQITITSSTDSDAKPTVEVEKAKVTEREILLGYFEYALPIEEQMLQLSKESPEHDKALQELRRLANVAAVKLSLYHEIQENVRVAQVTHDLDIAIASSQAYDM